MNTGKFFSSYFGKSIIATGGMGFSMALAYVFHILMVRMLSPASYGDLSILNALMVIATMPINSVQGLISREIAKFEKSGEKRKPESLVKSYLKKALIWGTATAIVLSLIAVMLFGSISPLLIGIILVSLSIPFGYASAVINGYFQGKEKIIELNVLYNVPMLLRVILAVGMVLAGFELVGAAISFPLSFVLVVFPIAMFMGWFSRENGKDGMNFDSSFARVLATNILMIVFIHSDLLIIRLLMGPESAAFYNTAGITARIPFYLSNSIVFVLLPQAAKLTFGNRWELLRRFLISLLFIVPIAPIFVLFGIPILSLLYGPLYGQMGAGAFSILALAMVVFGGANFLVNILWSQRKEDVPLALSALIIPVNLLLLYSFIPSGGLAGAATATLISCTLFLLAVGGATVYYSMRYGPVIR